MRRPNAWADRLSGVWSAAMRCLATARLEARLGLGSPAPWVIGLILGILGYLRARTQPDPSSYPIAWELNHSLGPLAAVLLLFLAASLAHRPVRYEVLEIQDSKPVGSEEIVLGRWLGMLATVLAPLVIMYLAAMGAQRWHARPPVEPLVYLGSLARALPTVLFFTTFAFCLVMLTRVLVLGAGLAALLWFGLYSGKSLYPPALRIDLSQNAPVFLGLAGAALLGMLLGYQSRRRARGTLTARVLALGLGLCCSATAVHASWISLALPGKTTATRSWKRLTARHRDERGPVPNFAWVDTTGKRVSLAGLRGRPALLVFFQPKDGGVTALLRRLSQLPAELAEEELQVLAICLSEDLNDSRDLARLAGVNLPLVTDWGRPVDGEFNSADPPSAIAWCLNINRTPAALLLNEQGRIISRQLSLSEDAWDSLKLEIPKALAGEE